jgi:tRNA threonylcarbamoyladenosine biosynthesis protein TsaE
VQGLAEGPGISEPITSPTFALAQHYDTGSGPGGGAAVPVHLDPYCLKQPAAADELFSQEEARGMRAVMAVIWPERLNFLPEGTWEVRLEIVGEKRRSRVISPAASSPDADQLER